MFKENQLSVFSQGAIYLLVGLLFLSCLVNIIKGVVPNPYYFGITIAGFIPFAIAKYSVISKGIKFFLWHISNVFIYGKLVSFRLLVNVSRYTMHLYKLKAFN